MFLVLVTLSCIIRHSYSYNLDTELPIIRKGDKGSYFGFSVATHSFFDDLEYLATPSKNYTWYVIWQIDLYCILLWLSEFAINFLFSSGY